MAEFRFRVATRDRGFVIIYFANKNSFRFSLVSVIACFQVFFYFKLEIFTMSDPLSALLAEDNDGGGGGGSDSGDLFASPVKKKPVPAVISSHSGTGSSLFANDDDSDDEDLFGRLAPGAKKKAKEKEEVSATPPKVPPKDETNDELAAADVSKLKLTPSPAGKMRGRRLKQPVTEKTEGRLFGEKDMFDNFPSMRKTAGSDQTITVTSFDTFVKKTADDGEASAPTGGGLFDGDDDDNDDDDEEEDDGVALEEDFSSSRKSKERGLFADDDNDVNDDRKIDDLFVAQQGVLTFEGEDEGEDPDDLFAGAKPKTLQKLTKAEKALMDLGSDDLLDSLLKTSSASKTTTAAPAVKGIAAAADTVSDQLDDDLFALGGDGKGNADDADAGFNFDAYISAQTSSSGGGGLFD